MWIAAIAFVIYFAQAWINTLAVAGSPVCETDGARPVDPAGRYACPAMSSPRLRVDDFDYELPPDAIAQTPAEPRDASRLLVLERATGTHPPRTASGTSGAGSTPATCWSSTTRASFRHASAPRDPAADVAEILVLRPLEGDPERWEALVRPSRRLPVGATVDAPSRRDGRGRGATGRRHPGGSVRWRPARDHGRRGRDATAAVHPRSVGSAGALPDRLCQPAGFGGGADRRAALHAGAARPAGGRRRRAGERSRSMSAWTRSGRSRASSSTSTTSIASGTRSRRRRGRRWARRIGSWPSERPRSASSRRLPAVEAGSRLDGPLHHAAPSRFRAVDALVTNFHLPRSSLLLLVTAFVQAGMDGADAFAARDRLLDAYRDALAEGYRFFSFGDAMLIV